MGGGGGAALMPPPASLRSRGGGGGALSRGPALLGGGGGRERGIVAVGTFCGALEGGGGGGNLNRSVESDLVGERDLPLPTNYTSYVNFDISEHDVQHFGPSITLLTTN